MKAIKERMLNKLLGKCEFCGAELYKEKYLLDFIKDKFQEDFTKEEMNKPLCSDCLLDLVKERRNLGFTIN